MTAIPITSTIIRAVKAMAKAQGVKTMKITGRNNIRILPANWIAGVHYDPEVEDADNNSYNGNKNDKTSNDNDEDDDNNKPITQEQINNLLADKQQHQQPPDPPTEQEANPTNNESDKNDTNDDEENSQQLETGNQPAKDQPKEQQEQRNVDADEHA